MVCYSPEGMEADADATQTMAQAEGLWAHALSVGLRRRLRERGASAPWADLCEDAMAAAWPERLRQPGRPALGFDTGGE